MVRRQLQQLVERFQADHQLPAASTPTIQEHFLPLAEWVRRQRRPGATFMLGISGAQGTGKSTLADLLRRVLDGVHDWNVALLSLDDVYLTQAERRQLADSVHPLLMTRGVPGTHDTNLLRDCLDGLRRLGLGEKMSLPRFDKSADDRAGVAEWPAIEGPVDLVILEGWCVGAVAQDDESLLEPVNELERFEDPAALWRRYANDRLREDYEPIFSLLDALVVLQAPGFSAVLEWRLHQERQLRARTGTNGPGLMSEVQVSRFIQFYERITRDNLQRLPDTADVVLTLDDDHRCIASNYRNPTTLAPGGAARCR